MMRLPSTSSPTTLSSRMCDLLRAGAEPDTQVTLLRYQSVTGVTRGSRCRRASARIAVLEALDHPVDALGQRADVVGLDGREHRRRGAGCGRACGRARCRRCRWRAASWPRPRRRRRRRSRWCRRPASAAAGSATNGVANCDASAQEYSRDDESAVRLTAQSRPPLPQQPVELLGQQHQRADRRGVVGLVLEAVVDRDRQRQEVGHPAARRRRSPRPGPARRGT